jgi:hypothetical protein
VIKGKWMNNATKILLIALGVMVILFSLPLIIGLSMMIFLFLIKMTWNLLWIVAIVCIAVAFALKK